MAHEGQCSRRSTECSRRFAEGRAAVDARPLRALGDVATRTRTTMVMLCTVQAVTSEASDVAVSVARYLRGLRVPIEQLGCGPDC